VFISRFLTKSSLVPECTIFEQFSFSFACFAISLAYPREDFVFKMRFFFLNEPNIHQWMFVVCCICKPEGVEMEMAQTLGAKKSKYYKESGFPI
jgi:hypothetical protein